MKKLIGLVLVFVMILVLCVPASAAEAGHPYPNLCDCNGGSLEYDGTYEVIQFYDDKEHSCVEYTAYYCTICDGYAYEYSRELWRATHYDNDNDGICDACDY